VTGSTCDFGKGFGGKYASPLRHPERSEGSPCEARSIRRRGAGLSRPVRPRGIQEELGVPVAPYRCCASMGIPRPSRRREAKGSLRCSASSRPSEPLTPFASLRSARGLGMTGRCGRRPLVAAHLEECPPGGLSGRARPGDDKRFASGPSHSLRKRGVLVSSVEGSLRRGGELTPGTRPGAIGPNRRSGHRDVVCGAAKEVSTGEGPTPRRARGGRR
jgi:hypothetical protein